MTAVFAFVSGITIALSASCTGAGTAAGPRPQTPAPSSTAPVEADNAAEEGADTVQRLLEAMESAGKEFSSLSADVLLTERDALTGEDVRRPGRFWLTRGEEETRFHVVFFGVLTNEEGERPRIRPEKIEYLLAGDTLVDRNYRTKTQVSRKLSAEQANRDLLKLGEGPFPLPIGQSPEEVREQFEVTLVDPEEVDVDEGDVEILGETRRLRLVPRDDSPLARDFSFVEIDVDPESGRPRQVITLDAAGENMKISEMQKIELDPELDPAVFELEQIDLSDWNLSYE